MIFTYFFHQFFWTLASFLLFYFCMKRYIISRLDTIKQRRDDYGHKLADQIATLNKKTESLQAAEAYIINEEIPQKQRSYINQRMEIFNKEFELTVLNEKDKIKRKLAKHRFYDFLPVIKEDAKIQAELHDI